MRPVFLALTDSDGFRLANPWALLLLLLIPLLAVLKGRKGQQGAIVFSSLHILHRLGPAAKVRAGGFRLALLFFALACIAVALSRPQSVRTTEAITESGIELIVAIDVSRSMQVDEDGFSIGGRRVNRLQAAKKVTRDFIAGRKTDRIGLVAFAGRPYLASPITLDHDWLEQSMQRIQIGLVEDGTAIGSAIAAAAKRLDKRPAKSKVIVLLTDGVNNAGQLSPIIAAKMAKTLGIKIYTIAVGGYGDFIIQTPQGPQRLVQEFDEETLKQIAQIADGAYFRAKDTSALEKVFALIDDLEKTEVRRKITVHAREWYQYPAAAALVLGLLSLVGGETFWRRFP
ncbi:MAG: VWA domain-containing protein [Verrucomicrobiae bacterium]|nr:VWA domain-containing protein [Verrucomicrobiae bacterium]MCB1087672.1 VWA domain-containing protein [Verrucomicrobiae bacterium]